MVESVLDLADSSVESPECYNTSSEITTTSDSREEEQSKDSPTTSSSQGKKKTSERSNSSAAKTTLRTRTQTSKHKIQDTGLNQDKMEEIASWIFSSEEANKVETEIRSSLVDDSRIKLEPERKRFAEHILDVPQKQFFQLLIAGFCRKFSTLAKAAFDSNEKYKKAAFCFVDPGKTTQVCMILDKLLNNTEISCPDAVHCVVSVLHESVYTIIHEHVRVTKTDSENTGEASNLTRNKLAEETDDTLYRYCGAALHHIIKLGNEALAGKKGRGVLSSKRKAVMEKEVVILQELVMKDKSHISSSLKNPNEGNLVFPRNEMIAFLRSVDNEVREFATDANLRKYPSKFLAMCQNAVLNNEYLEVDFRMVACKGHYLYKLYFPRTNFIIVEQTLFSLCKLYSPRTNFIFLVQTLFS